MKKTILILVMALLLLFALVACNETEDPPLYCDHQDSCYLDIFEFPTCTASGRGCMKCRECYVYTDDVEIPPRGHKYDSDCDIFCNRCRIERTTETEHVDLPPIDNRCDLCGQYQNTLGFSPAEDGIGYRVCGIVGVIYDGDLIIPARYNGKPVTAIGLTGFDHCEGLMSVVIPDTVITIGERAFMDCKNLTSIIIPKSVQTIQWAAFYNCESLTEVFFTGTEEEWNAIYIDYDNESLFRATIHFNYVPEQEIDLN